MDYKKEYEYLKQEIEDRKYREEQEYWQRVQQREDERRQRKAERLAELCRADDWWEAFHKGISRLQHEAGYLDEDGFFAELVEQHKFAYERFKERNLEHNPARRAIEEEYQKKLAALEESIREQVAADVDYKFGEGTEIAENLRNDDYEALVNW